MSLPRSHAPAWERGIVVFAFSESHSKKVLQDGKPKYSSNDRYTAVMILKRIFTSFWKFLGILNCTQLHTSIVLAGSLSQSMPPGCVSLPHIGIPVQHNQKSGSPYAVPMDLRLKEGWQWLSGESSLSLSLPLVTSKVISWFQPDTGHCEQILMIPPEAIADETGGCQIYHDPLDAVDIDLLPETTDLLIEAMRSYELPEMIDLWPSIELSWRPNENFLYFREKQKLHFQRIEEQRNAIRVIETVHFAWQWRDQVFNQTVCGAEKCVSEPDEINAMLHFLASLSSDHSLSVSYTDIQGDVWFVVIDRTGKRIVLSELDVILLQFWLSDLALVRHIPELVDESMIRGIAPEKWRAENRIVPWTTLFRLARLIAGLDLKEKRLNLLEQVYYGRQAPKRGKRKSAGEKPKKKPDSRSEASRHVDHVDKAQQQPAFFLPVHKTNEKQIVNADEFEEVLEKLLSCKNLIKALNRPNFEGKHYPALLVAFMGIRYLDVISSRIRISRDLQARLHRGGKRGQVALNDLIDETIPLFLDYLNFALQGYKKHLVEIHNRDTENSERVWRIEAPLIFVSLLQMMLQSRGLLFHPRMISRMNQSFENLQLDIALCLGMYLIHLETIVLGKTTIELHISEEAYLPNDITERKLMDKNLKDGLFSSEQSYCMKLGSLVFQEFWQEILVSENMAHYEHDQIKLLYQALLISLNPEYQHGLTDNEVRGVQLLHYPRQANLALENFLGSGEEAIEQYTKTMLQWLEMVSLQYTWKPDGFPVDSGNLNNIHKFFSLQLSRLRLLYQEQHEGGESLIAENLLQKVADAQALVMAYEQKKLDLANEQFALLMKEEELRIKQEHLAQKQQAVAHYQKLKAEGERAIESEPRAEAVLDIYEPSPWEESMKEAHLALLKINYKEALHHTEQALGQAKNKDEKILSMFENVFIRAHGIEWHLSPLHRKRRKMTAFEQKVRVVPLPRVRQILSDSDWQGPQEAFRRLVEQQVPIYSRDERHDYMTHAGEALARVNPETVEFVVALFEGLTACVKELIQSVDALYEDVGGELCLRPGHALITEDIFVRTEHVKIALQSAQTHYHQLVGRSREVVNTLIKVKEINRLTGVYGRGEVKDKSEETVMSEVLGKVTDQLRRNHADSYSRFLKTLGSLGPESNVRASGNGASKFD